MSVSPRAQSQVPAGNNSGGILLVANQGDHSVSFIDTAQNRQIAVVSEDGVTGHEVAVIPGRDLAVVPIYGNSGVGKPGTDGHSIDVIDMASRKRVGKIDFGHGVRPHCAVYDPVSRLLYVTTELDHVVSIIDPRTLKIVGSIPTGQAESHMLAISHDGRRGYTANVGPGTVSVLDMGARKIITVIPISRNTQRISISNDDRRVFTADQTKPQLAVIDTSTNKVSGWVPLPGLGYGTAPTKNGRWLMVTIPSISKVAVVDLRTMKVVRSLDVPKSPTEILVRPDGLVAYVSCGNEHKIAVIDVPHWRVVTLIEAGRGADGMAWSPASSRSNSK